MLKTEENRKTKQVVRLEDQENRPPPHSATLHTSWRRSLRPKENPVRLKRAEMEKRSTGGTATPSATTPLRARDVNRI